MGGGILVHYFLARRAFYFQYRGILQKQKTKTLNKTFSPESSFLECLPEYIAQLLPGLSVIILSKAKIQLIHCDAHAWLCLNIKLEGNLLLLFPRDILYMLKSDTVRENLRMISL